MSMLSAHLLPNSLISPALAHQPSLLQNKLALATLIYFAPSCFPTVPTPEGMALTWPPPRRFALTPEAHGFLSQLPIAPPPRLLLWPTAREGLVPFYPSQHQPLTLQSTVLRICRSGSLHRAPGAGAGGARCWRPDLVMAFLQKRRQLRPAEHLVTQLPSLLTWDLCSHCDLRPQPKAKIGTAIGRVEYPL